MGRWIAIGLILAAVWTRPAAAESPLGRWLTQDREGVIEVTTCGTGFCGRVIGMLKRSRADGTPVLDPQGHPQCGLVILRETQQVEANLWRARITNPDDGDVWRCELWVDGGTLHLRGYVLVPLLGKTTDWTRYTGSIGPACFMG